MKINQIGLELLKKFEGLVLESYPDPASPLGIIVSTKKYSHYTEVPDWQKLSGDPWTIGYGSTGKDVGPGMVWTKEQAENWLSTNLETFEHCVSTEVSTSLNDNQFSALVCLTYNIGPGSFSKSTLLKKVNQGKFVEAADEFLKWGRAGGKVIPGLIKRREAEKVLFLT